MKQIDEKSKTSGRKTVLEKDGYSMMKTKKSVYETKTEKSISEIFRNISIFVLAVALLFFMLIITTSQALALQDLMALQGTANNLGDPITNGDLRVTIWTQATGGTQVYDSSTDYNGAIVNGKFDVMLGDGSQDLDLEYGKIYYMDISINGQDLDFNGSERRSFESSVGKINATGIVSASLLNVNDSQYLQGYTASIFFANDTALSSRIDSINSTKTNAGTCPAGQYVQNTTASGVQCAAVSAGNPFDQNLNTNDNVQFRNVTASNVSVTNIFATSLFGQLNWSYLLNIPSFVKDYSADITAKLDATDQRYNDTARIDSLNLSKLNASDQRYNDTARIDSLNVSKLNASDQRYNDTASINAVNTSGNIQSLGFNITSQLQNLFYSISNPSGYISAVPSTYALKSDIVGLVGNWSLDKSSYNTTTQLNNIFLALTDQRFNESSRIDSVNSTVQSLLTSNTSTNVRIDSLNSTVQSLVTSNTSTNTRITNVNNTVQSLVTSNTSTNSRIDSVNSTVQSLLTSNTSTNARIDSVNSSVQNKLDATDQRYNDSARIDSLNSTKATAANCAAGTVAQNTTTGGVQCVDITGIDPAGSSGAIQYNNNSLTTGSTQATITTEGFLNLANVTTIPTTPTSGGTLFTQNIGNYSYLGMNMPSGRVVFIQPSLRDDDVCWCVPPHSGVAATAMQCNGLTLGTTVGTVSNPAPVSTNFSSQLTRSLVTSAATAGSGSENKGAQLNWWRGNAAGLGGFIFAWKGGWSSISGNGRGCVGMFGTTGALSVAADCNAATNSVYVGFMATNTTLSICSNDAAGTATCPVNCGANFPAGTAGMGAVYLVNIYTQKNGGGYWVNVQRQDSEVPDCNGYLSTDIPANTQFLTWHIFCNNGGTAAACAVYTTKLYLSKDN